MRERGCDWRDTLSRAIQHIKECGFLRVEKSGKVVCVEKRQAEREYSARRVLKCEFCDKTVMASEINLHMGECEGFLVVCPNGCKVAGETGIIKVKRGDVPLHLAECPLQTVKCPYWEHGCGEEMERRQLDLHEREFIHIHFKLSMKELREIKQMQIESNNKIELLETQNAELKESISTHVSTGRLEWKVKGVKQKIGNKENTLSDSFFVGLYMCQCKIEWKSNTGKVGCFICIINGQYDETLKWPFIYRYKFVLLNQDRNQEDYTQSAEVTNKSLEKSLDCFLRPTKIRNNGFGYPSFITNAEILTEKYCRDDSIHLQITVEQLPFF